MRRRSHGENVVSAEARQLSRLLTDGLFSAARELLPVLGVGGWHVKIQGSKRTMLRIQQFGRGRGGPRRPSHERYLNTESAYPAEPSSPLGKMWCSAIQSRAC